MIAELGLIDWLPDGVTRLEALEAIEEFSLADQPFDRRTRAQLRADLVEALFEAHRHPEGLALVERARLEFEDVPELLVEMLLLSANANENLGEFATAVEHASQAEYLLEHLPEGRAAEPYAAVYARLVRAKILIQSGVPDQAYTILVDARRTAEEAGADYCESMLLTAETEAAQARGDWLWIIDRIGSALDAGPIPGDEPQDRVRRELDVSQARALLAMQRQRGQEIARTELVSALSALAPLDPYGWSAALTLCELDLALGHIAAAERRATSIAERVLGSGLTPSLPVQSNLAGVRGRIALESRAGPDELSLRRSDAEAALSALLRAWDSVQHREGGVGFLHFDERRALLVTAARLQPTAEDVLELLLEVDKLGSLTRHLELEAASVQQVQERLVPDHGGLLVYVPSAWGSVALTLDARGGRVWTLPGSDTWTGLESDLAREMQPQNARSSGATKRCTEVAESLRERLIPTELDALISTWEEIVLVRTENVGRIPFEALPLAGRGGAPLGLELATSYLPSLRVGLGLLERRAGRTASGNEASHASVTILVGPREGDPDRADGSGALIPWNHDDSRRLARPWPPEFVEVVSDPARALQRLTLPAPGEPLLLEVFAHGVRDPDLEGSQGIDLGGSAPVFAGDLSAVNAPPLTILLVCEASAGVTRRGDDLGSLMAASLLVGGADVVGGSRRDLSFHASVALMEEFHRALATGATPSRALLAARRELASRAEWRHPAFHSNLSLTGLAFAPAPSGLKAEVLGADPQGHASESRGWWGRALVACVLLAGSGLAIAVALRARVPSRK